MECSRISWLIVCAMAGLQTTAMAETPSERAITVSPGSVKRVLRIAGGSPTFSWGSVKGASRYDLAVYELPTDGEEGQGAAEPVKRLSAALPGNALSWTPSLERSLPPGEYFWYVRARDRRGPGVWSEARFFAVDAMPSAAEAANALKTLNRYLAVSPELAASLGVSIEPTDETDEREGKNADESTDLEPKGRMQAISKLITGDVAISAVTNSALGAAVVAENTANGADLVLGGTTPAILTETGFQRDSGSDLAFNFANASGGTMTLQVDGSTVVTEASGTGLHDHVGESWSGTGNTFSVESTGAGPVNAITGVSNNSGNNSVGVYGEANGGNGRGVLGKVTQTTGGGTGVRGESPSIDSNAFGVFGIVTSSSASGAGVKGKTNGGGTGVYGQGFAGTGVKGEGVTGVRGDSPSGGVGVEGTSSGIGVAGTSPTGTGVYGQSDGTTNFAKAVYGKATSPSGVTYGVYGESQSLQGAGVYGVASDTNSTVFNVGVQGLSESSAGAGVFGAATATGVLGFSAGTNEGYAGVEGWAYADTGTADGVRGVSDSASGHGGHFIAGRAGGTALVGVNTNNTGNILELYAATTEREFYVDFNGGVFADGAYHCGNNISDAAGTLDETEISACLRDSMPADFAEMLPANTAATLGPGDVLVLEADGRLGRSSTAYQANVGGVFSTRPSYLGNSRYASEEDYAPLAMVGIVPVKVSGENGAIAPGSLLVASSIPGHAMFAGPEAPQGSVIGKALEALPRDAIGVIKVLVMLQ